MVRRRRSPALQSALPPAFRPLIQLWICRILVHAGGLKQHLRTSTDARELLQSTGSRLQGNLGEAPAEIQAALRERVMQRLAVLEAKGAGLPVSSPLHRNLEHLEQALGLSVLERVILAFLVLVGEDNALESGVDELGNMTMTRLQTVLAATLGWPVRAVQEALRPDAILVRSGLVRIERQDRWGFTNKIELLEGLSDGLMSRHKRPFDLFCGCFIAVRPPELTLEHYPQLASDLATIVPYLRQACATGQKGVNILLHGVPGTGKTQLALALAAAVGADLHEVAHQHADGSPIPGEHRFRAYHLSQAVLGRGRGRIVLFDEVEDVFRKAMEQEGPERSNRSGIKAWVNRTLEENPVPALWITNAPKGMDVAVLRRFDYVLEVSIPPQRVRERLLEYALEGLPVDAAWKRAMATHEGLAPALVSRAARVIRAARCADPNLDSAKAFPRALGNLLEVMGMPATPRQLPDQPTRYRLDLLQTDCDLGAVLEGLRTTQGGRICLYGPPGTGKTAFGRHLAEQLQRRLIVRRASDLLGPYVGQTEKAMAQMFDEAREERAVLLLDEADGFLRDRQNARQSWEASFVNEMLTQMEGYPGVFVASTNLMDTLDPAAMRRFDLKVRFDYLTPEQVRRLVEDAAEDLQLAPAEPVDLRGLQRLTPGDMAAVLRQARFRPIDSRHDLVERLRQECGHKPEGGRRVIGF